MIQPPSLENLERTVNVNIHDPDDLGETIKHLNRLNITSDELRLTQCHLELAYILIQSRQTYAT